MYTINNHIVVFLIVLCALSVTRCTDSAKGGDESRKPDAALLPISTWKLPQKLTFCGEPVPLEIYEVRERAEREFYVNLQTPGQIILYLKRSGRYFPTYERLLKEANAPDDLKFLSVAESALFMARSPKDAVGLWQFIPATGKAYGLIINDEVDERRHIEKSTQAAIAYLKAGRQANGSWTNAAAGYNMGHENLNKNTQFQQRSNYYDLFLNEETSRYILRIAVIKYIMEHAHSFGIVVPANERYIDASTQLVAEKSSIPSIAEWAQAHGTTYKDVKLLNPWILGRGLPSPPNKGWEITVPR